MREPALSRRPPTNGIDSVTDQPARAGDAQRITIFLADDSLLVREGVRALLAAEPDLEVIGVAEDFDGLVKGAAEAKPQVVVTDIRMPPNFQDEGIEAAKLVRKRHPGTGVVILSQYDEPEYAISLLSDGAAGYAYLLKERVGDGDQLVRAIREVATGGSMLDPAIVNAMVTPARSDSELDEREDQLLQWIAEGRPVKAIASTWNITPEAANEAVEDLFLKLAKAASSGAEGALRRLRLLQKAIADREEQGETLGRLLPGGLVEKLRRDGRAIGESERLEVTVLMSDVRGYSGIAEHVDPTVLAGMLNNHRIEMNAAILSQSGTVMQYVGDAVMAVFGAPFAQEDHADRALAAACAMHERQRALNARWREEGLPEFGIGIGVSTGEVAAALLGSEERIEYTLVGDTVNLAQRLQDLARPAGTTVLSAATVEALRERPAVEPMGEQHVKGREGAVHAFRVVTTNGAPASVDTGG
jgi:class 3 adenylate cyclase/FixJ family two-component response regulator